MCVCGGGGGRGRGSGETVTGVYLNILFSLQMEYTTTQYNIAMSELL